MKYVALFLTLRLNLNYMQKYLRIRYIPANPHLCGGPPPVGEQCKRHFPRPLANRTYHDPTSLHYVYKAITEEDRCVVPYHAPTLVAHYNMLPIKGLLDI